MKALVLSVSESGWAFIKVEQPIGPVINEVVGHMKVAEGATLKAGDKFDLPEGCKVSREVNKDFVKLVIS